MRPFRDLIVWQKAHTVALAIYRETASFPRDEMYGLTSQMRRSASSVPTNIAEGSARDGHREFHQFLAIALGSAAELEYQILLSKDLGYLTVAKFDELDKNIAEVKRMLVALKRSLTANSQQLRASAPQGPSA